VSPLFDTFKARAEAASAEVHCFSTNNQARDFILGFLRDENVADAPGARAVWVRGSLLDGVDCRRLAEQTPGLTFNVTREAAESSKIGISQLEWAIADTGTLVTDAAPVERRLVSSLPVIHIAVVPTGAIEPGTPSVLACIHPSQSGYISMITGPSRTADIERVLTIGVHGPSRLVIVFVDELGSNR
jgi:L-lactate dehydrogenase complex protein LldG